MSGGYRFSRAMELQDLMSFSRWPSCFGKHLYLILILILNISIVVQTLFGTNPPRLTFNKCRILTPHWKTWTVSCRKKTWQWNLSFSVVGKLLTNGGFFHWSIATSDCQRVYILGMFLGG